MPGERRRVRPARAPARIVRPPRARIRSAASSIPTRGATLRSGRAGRALAARSVHDGGLLRTRAARGVRRRRLVPHRRPRRRRRGRLLLLQGTPRRHDQDQRRERLAARGRGGDPRSHRAHRARRRHRRRRPRSGRRGGGPSCRPGARVDVDELAAQLAARLSAYKVPRRFLLLADDAVPVLSSGKLDRPALEALFDAG